MHLRRQIRALVHGRLTTELAGVSVYRDRRTPVDESDLPVVAIDIRGESVEPLHMGAPRAYARSLTIDVAAQAAGGATPDDLDDLVELIEQALAPGAWSDALLFDLRLTALSETLSADGEQIVGATTLTFEAEYHAAEGDPSQPVHR